MRITRLRLANVRAIEAAEFRFEPGLNLIVGVNGVGKTTVLDALAVCLSAVVKQANQLRGRVKAFSAADIRIGTEALTVECEVTINGKTYSYLIHRPRETSVPQKAKAGMPREQVHETPERAEFVGDSPGPIDIAGPSGQPLALLFSTNRAVPSERAPSKSAAAGGIVAATADAFASRELRLGEFAAWMRVQKSLEAERPETRRVLAACKSAVERFLPGYKNLRLGGEHQTHLVVDREATTIPVRGLSDGERGSLALVLDLTRRLSQANPALEDPAKDAEAIVLLDEIELHLHPKWQREIAHNLGIAFPLCQFIATSHSPQIIGEVEHERIQIMAHGQIYSPTHSLGVDSSRVLEEIMDTDPRTEEVGALLSTISKAIGKQQYEQARKLVTELSGRLGDSDPEVTRLRMLLGFMEGEE